MRTSSSRSSSIHELISSSPDRSRARASRPTPTGRLARADAAPRARPPLTSVAPSRRGRPRRPRRSLPASAKELEALLGRAATSPTRRRRSPPGSPCGWSGRSCSKGPRAWARPTWRAPPPRRSAGRSCASSATRGSTRPRRSTSGTTPSRCSTRSSCATRSPGEIAGAASLAEAADRRRRERGVVLQRALPHRAPAPRGARRARRPAVLLDRRGRPRRPRVRGLPARDALRAPGDDPRARHDQAPTHPPLVLLTTNATREMTDALRRRCLHAFLDYPPPSRELAILELRVPGHRGGARRAARRPSSQALRALDLRKAPVDQRDHRLGARARSCSASARSTRSSSQDTLGAPAQAPGRQARRRAEARRAPRRAQPRRSRAAGARATSAARPPSRRRASRGRASIASLGSTAERGRARAPPRRRRRAG